MITCLVLNLEVVLPVVAAHARILELEIAGSIYYFLSLPSWASYHPTSHR